MSERFEGYGCGRHQSSGIGECPECKAEHPPESGVGEPPDFSGSLRWTSEDEKATMKAPDLSFFVTAQPPLPDCPSCGRKRKMGEKVTVTANNGTTTLWEGCWGCVVDRLTFDIGRVSLLEAEVRAIKEGR